ncbi:thioesterase family protein [Paraburkholderia sp. BL21I4N1]|uniref:acyl-CoA thioesterase n=1 Tax=Paraburkholderia sp. BL21I4N1 TaxID=1938801 RepID=UPI000CFBFE7E|nr:thioesterase family protein [Paraburkholderia sp. BL21I4N1]PQV53995.1 acyl-CoA thioester hydrolase [Paraburkholderia sp. BL21I4N1]
MAVHVYPCPIRWADMDVYGVVNNVSILRLLEEARVDLIWRLGAQNGDAFFSGGSVVVSHSIVYKSPLVHRHVPIDIHMWVSEIRAASVTIDYEIKDDDTVYAVATTAMAPYNYEGRHLRRIDAREEAFLERFFEDRRAIKV